jgi:glycosyltransferase involved in cell wall biosynthesis
MSASTRVTVVQEAVLQYRVRFYELLRGQLASDGVELTLIHSNPVNDTIWRDAVDLPWATRVPPRRWRISRSELLWQPCRKLLAGSDLVIVEQASRHLLNYLLAVEQRLGRRRPALWGHGRNFRAISQNRAAERAKASLSRTAHWWFAYTALSAEVVEATGFPRERITVVNNAVDSRGLARAVAALDDTAAARIREELGLDAPYIGLFMGGLSSDKRLDYLCEAADAVRATVGEFALLVAGAGPEEARIREFARSRPWVRYVGPRFGEDKAALLRVADVLLMPAWAGLVVVDAFAAEVPIVVSASHAHPPEIAYVRDGDNGLVVHDGGSAQQFGRSAAALLCDPKRRRALAEGCRDARDRYTVEEMASRFASGIRNALAS